MKHLFSVRVSNKAEKQIRDLDSKMKERVLELLKVLEEAPVPTKQYDLVKLGGREDSYRIRLSSHRMVYAVFWKDKIVRVAKVERKSDNTY